MSDESRLQQLEARVATIEGALAGLAATNKVLAEALEQANATLAAFATRLQTAPTSSRPRRR
jgi:uncharacterized coiled-coil protein SlyX